MRQKPRIVLLPLFIICLLALTNCKKENPPAPSTSNTPSKDGSNSNAARTQARNYITGYLGGEQITIDENPSYFTRLIEENDGTAGPARPTGDGDPNSGPTSSTVVLVTGTKWNTSDAQGMIMNAGTIEIRNEIFRIYVTPFLSNLYYGMLTPAIHGFANGTTVKSGAYIAIRDNQGVLWTSEGSQQGSFFLITYRGANMQSYANAFGFISCKLYDGNGNVKTFFTTGFNANFGLQ